VLYGDFRIEMPEFEIRETAGVSELRVAPEVIARGIIRRIFELFSWNDRDKMMLDGWQRKLLQRQFRGLKSTGLPP
jgi:hypothetical protein